MLILDKRTTQNKPAKLRAETARPWPAKDRQTLLMAFGTLFIVLVLLGPVMSYGDVLAAGSYTGEGSVIRQFAYILCAVAIVFACLREGRSLKLLLMPWPILLVLLWCALSLSWAVNPDIGMRRLFLTALAVWLPFILVANAGYTKTLHMLRGVFVVALAANYLTVLIDPVLGTHVMLDSSMPTALIGNWRGLLGHKNIAGAECALLILLFVFDARTIRPAIRFGVIAAATFFLFKTQSKTSGGMVVMAMMVGYIFQRVEHRKRAIAVPFLMIFTSIFWFLYSAYGDFVIQNYLSPTSFTGRGHIWNSLLRYADDHPLTGAGFGSFWNVGADSPVYKYGQGYVTDITAGHNGYIDLLITIGVPGIVLTVFATLIWPVWQVLAHPIDARRGALVSALLLFCMGHNITESSIFERDSFVGVILMFAIAFAAQRGEDAVDDSGRASGTDVFAALRSRAARSDA